jgi:ABC-type Mn2+/Zn2+ transport system ATPase subunit
MPVSELLLRVVDLAAGYGARSVLRDVSFELHGGERIGVLGPNGGGKSTLFRALLGELEPRHGSIEGPARYGFVPQTERSRLDYPVTALDVALMGTLSRVPWWRFAGGGERRAARAALGRVGLAEHAGTQFGELSGGQRQRVLVARALVQDARVLLLDEPFTGVDRRSGELLESLFADLAAEGRGLLIATHDLEQVRAWEQVLCLNGRMVAFGKPQVTLTSEVLDGTVGTQPVHHHHDDEIEV